MKLIDILNKIANGELKKGAKIKVSIMDDVYTYNWACDLVDEKGKQLFDNYTLYALHQEVELIEPNDSPDVGEMAEPTDNTKIEELDAYELDLLKIFYKLNEVIRYINKGAEE